MGLYFDSLLLGASFVYGGFSGSSASFFQPCVGLG